MQFVYANADRKWGDLQQPIWLSLRANCVWQIWWSSMMTLQETVDEEVASTWTWAKHLMLSCKTSLSLSGEAGFDQYSTWWIRNWLDDFSQKSCSISIKRPVTTAVPQGSVPAPSLFNVFVSDTVRDDTVTGIEGTLSKFASNTKLCRAVDMLEERNAKEVGPCEASNSTRPSTRSCILVGVIPSTTQAGQRSD